MHLPTPDPAGSHPRGTVPPLPGTLGRAVWPVQGERQEQCSETRAQALLCRQKRESQSKPHWFIASAVRSRGAQWLWTEHPDSAVAVPGDAHRLGTREEESCLCILTRRQRGERGDGDIPVPLSPAQPVLCPVHRDGAAEDVHGGAQDGAVGQGHGVVPSRLHLSLQERQQRGLPPLVASPPAGT